MAKNDLRGQLKATFIKKLKKRVEEDDKIVGASGNNEYLNLIDGKTLKIRIFPAHPGNEDFYVPKKCYWLTITNKDGEERRTTVLDSKIHGGTKYDIVEEYVKFDKDFKKKFIWNTETCHYGDKILKTKGKFFTLDGDIYKKHYQKMTIKNYFK